MNAGRVSGRGDMVACMSSPVNDQPTWLPWVVAAGFAVAVVALIGLGDAAPSIPERALYTIVPVMMTVAVLVAATADDEPIVVGAVLVAIAPSVVVAMAGGEPAALLAAVGAVAGLVLAGPRFAAFDPGVRTMVAASAFVVLGAAWWLSTPARADAAPSWQAVVSQTGETLRRTVVGVGADGRTTALASLLVWLLAVGLLVGAALLSARPVVAAAVPGAFAVIIVGTWLIERWRGPVEAGSAMWVLAGSCTFTAASMRREHGDRAIGRTVLVLAALALLLGIVHQVRRSGATEVRIVVGAIAAALAAMPVWWSVSRSRPPGVMPGPSAGSAASVSTMNADNPGGAA